MVLHRMYFDTNERDASGRYHLGIAGSLRDIAPIAERLREGIRVIIYMTGELEMEATLEFDMASGAWMARPIEGTLKYTDGSDEPSN
jgi:hypothetical protein